MSQNYGSHRKRTRQHTKNERQGLHGKEEKPEEAIFYLTLLSLMN